MFIEEEFFANYETQESSLLEYGFVKKGGILVYEKPLPVTDMRLVLSYDDGFSGKIFDTAIGEEYTNFRRPGASGFSAEVKEAFTDALKDIREKCCQNLFFRSAQMRRLCLFIKESFGSQPEFLWKKLPIFAAYRRKESGKWFALTGLVPRNKVDRASPSQEKIEVLNIKIEKSRLAELLAQKGIFEAYHMNKKSWISIIMDDSASDEIIKPLLREAYESVKHN
ncbi:MmcQ/YjbR family DNA-binding protein [Treponema sp. UBA3813]|uniref:MmcQ/YjbR family DNA-binding protein n=1 Tax=Treponema sp. UBA3813 TaxID=1947715 RepID=UPI0025F69BB1|nr:MmcQ/YjbR family DNA-binding protein [Treponema sp. UBA3813]